MAGPEFDKASKKFSGRYFAVSSEWGLGNEVTAESYKRECQEKNLPFGSMPVDFLSRHSAQLPERALLF